MYVNHLMELHLLKQAGFPFGADDLPLSMWQDLGVLAGILESKRVRLF